MAIFGYTGVGDGTLNFDTNYVVGNAVTCPTSGIATKLTGRFGSIDVANELMRGMIYKTSDKSLVGQTVEVTLPNSLGLPVDVDFAMVGSPALVGGTSYILMLWGTSFDVHLYRLTTGPLEYYDHDDVYVSPPLNPPDPITVWDEGTTSNAIYCTYTEAGGRRVLPLSRNFRPSNSRTFQYH